MCCFVLLKKKKETGPLISVSKTSNWWLSLFFSFSNKFRRILAISFALTVEWKVNHCDCRLTSMKQLTKWTQTMFVFVVVVHYFPYTVEQRYNDLPRVQLSYIFTSEYHYIWNLLIKIGWKINQNNRYIGKKQGTLPWYNDLL